MRCIRGSGDGHPGQKGKLWSVEESITNQLKGLNRSSDEQQTKVG